MAIVYAFVPDTGEFIRSFDDGLPVGETLLDMTGLTYDLAPLSGDFETPVYQNGAWTNVPDYRNAELFSKTGAFVDYGAIQLGDSLDDHPDLTTISRPSLYHIWDNIVNDWSIDPVLQDAENHRIWKIEREFAWLQVTRNISAYEDAQSLTGWGTPTDSGISTPDYQVMVQYRYDLATTSYPSILPPCPVSLPY